MINKPEKNIKYINIGDTMNIISSIIKRILIFEKEPQTIGLSQLKSKTNIINKNEPSLKHKDVKLSDLMRRAG